MFGVCIVINAGINDTSGIEHRASLSRDDRQRGQPALANAKPSPTQINKVLACSSNGQIITGLDMVKCRQKLEADSVAKDAALAQNPKWKTEKTIAFFESVLALRVLAGANSPDGVKVDYLRSFLLEERIPNGWPKHQNWGIPEFLAGLAKAEGTGIWETIKAAASNFKDALNGVFGAKDD